MIIQLSDSAINKQAVKALISEHPQQVLIGIVPCAVDADDQILTIMNLDANGREQRFLAPQILAQKLVQLGFLAHIERIQLLISDIDPEAPMLGYATKLSQTIIQLLPDSAITVCVPADLTDCILIKPPEDAEKNWTLYSLPSHELQALELPAKVGLLQGNFEFYRSKMPHIAYEGSIDIKLQEVGSQLDPETVRQTFGL